MAEQASSLLGTESQPPGPETEYKHVPASIAHSISSPSKSGSGTLSIPSPLKRSKTRLLSGILVDLILGGAAVLFLVLAILVRIHDNEPVAENRRLVSSLQEAMQYVSLLDMKGSSVLADSPSGLNTVPYPVRRRSESWPAIAHAVETAAWCEHWIAGHARRQYNCVHCYCDAVQPAHTDNLWLASRVDLGLISRRQSGFASHHEYCRQLHRTGPYPAVH